jgi:hypothetical protein
MTASMDVPMACYPCRSGVNAETSEKVKANPHLTEAIKYLKEAIDEGKQGHADVATTMRKAALNHLRQAM